MSEDAHTSEDNMKGSALSGSYVGSAHICALCGGPVGIGELCRQAWNPKTQHLYITHWFSSDCLWHQEQAASSDAEFCKAVGIVAFEVPPQNSGE